MSSTALTVILTHERADFDALASLLGAALLFPAALPILPTQLNRNVREFVALYRNQFPFLQARELPRQSISQVIVVDTRSANLPKGIPPDATYRIIDHHVDHEPLPPNWTRWHEPLGANVTLLLEQIIEQRIDITPVQATLFALGIHEDTGSLTYATSTARDARCLAWLMEPEQGVNLEILHQFLRHPLSKTQRSLLEELSEQSEALSIDGHTVVIAQAQAPKLREELNVLAHRLREEHEAAAVFLVVGLGDIVQVVARSVTDDIDVGGVARQLGGGGHRRAAAAAVETVDTELVRNQIVELLADYVQPAVTVQHIMTSGRPQMISPELTIQQATELMRRYGHEGFPVVRRNTDGEQLLGVLTRREADRALNHGLNEQPVRRFMQTGPRGKPATVRPQDSIATLRQTMIESGWGQIPVVDDSGKIIGIVTRTDLIKLWGDALPSQHQAEALSKRLSAVLPPAQLQLLRLIGQEADRINDAVYVVGGFVRDLLLEHPQLDVRGFDMDIVIEGDAIAFAHHLQNQHGGRLVTHRRFGTAKWLLQDEKQPVQWSQLQTALLSLGQDAEQIDDIITLQQTLPPHLDFVTARTEFYTAPTALPTVELSNIKLDLHRRDFTINTLAISLSPDRWANLLDFYGGVPDLERGLIRVLHSLSFVDDPTRILRAVRYEQRFGFQLETRTLELLQDAAELLDRITPARLRHELERILLEARPELVLRRLAELRLLRRIHPELLMDEWVETQFARLREVLQGNEVDPRLASEPIERLYWALLTLRLPSTVHEELTARLGLRTETQQLMSGLALLNQALPQLRDPEQTPSQLVKLLEPIDPVAQALYLVVSSDSIVTTRMRRYYTDWQQMRPQLTGVDLQALDVPRGPAIGFLLQRLRAARLDGEIHSREEEEAIVRQWVEQTKQTAQAN
jgi:tRNA nucleotidyltransferase (CCA-adding enzyme)